MARKTRGRYGDGSVGKVKRKKGPGWRASWWDEAPDGSRRKRVSPVFDSEDEARTWNRARLDGRTPARSTGVKTFGDAARAWLNGRGASNSTVAGYRRSLTGHLLPHLGGFPLGAIDAAALNAYASGKLDGTIDAAPGYSRKLSRAYLRSHMWIVRSVYDFARYERWLSDDYNPARSPSLKIDPAGKTSKPTARRLTRPEQNKLKAVVPDEWQAFTIVALLGCGLRFGEAAGLKWGDRQKVSDEETGEAASVLHVWRTAHPDGTLADKPKTHHSRRSIGLSPSDAAELQRHWRRQNAKGMGDDDDLMFPTTTGTVQRDNNFTRRKLKPWARAAELQPISPHVLRHTFAYNQARAGCPARTLKELMGHSTATFTLDVYGGWLKGVDVPVVVPMIDSRGRRSRNARAAT